MNETITSKIKALPPLSRTIIDIQKTCADENSSAKDLSKIIETDPMLTANILHSANSPLYGFSREITDINRAIALFGMSTIKGFALASAVKKSFSIRLSPYNITESEFSHISAMQSAFMFAWYMKIDRSMLDILAPASFLMEIGKIILANEAIEKGIDKQFAQAVATIDNTKDLDDLELKFFESTNEEVTASIFEQWNLEKELVDAILYSNNPSDAPEYIRPYSNALKIVKNSINVFYKLNEEKLQKYAISLVESFGLDKNIFLEVASKVRNQ